LYAELPQKTHIWQLDDKSVIFSVSVFNNTQSAVYVPERWGSSTKKWITDKGDGMSHTDGSGITDKDLILVPAQQTHTYTFTIYFPKDRMPAGSTLKRLEYSVDTFGIGGDELTKPIALRGLEAIIDLTPNQSTHSITASGGSE
jgi:hypothetical protein